MADVAEDALRFAHNRQLRTFLKQYDICQKALADVVGCSQGDVSNWVIDRKALGPVSYMRLLVAIDKIVSERKQMKKALWVGGPPGQTQIRIKEKLRADGIDVVLWTLSPILPTKDVDVVLINKDMIGHHENAKQKQLCKDAGKTFVTAHTSYTPTRQALVQAGIIAEKPAAPPAQTTIEDVVLAQPPEPDMPAPAPAPAPSALPAVGEADALREFLLKLPASLRAVAIDAAKDLERRQEDEAVFEALVGLLALASRSDDALLRGVKELKTRPNGSAVLRRLAGAIELEGLK